MDVELLNDYVGNVIGDITSRRGRLETKKVEGMQFLFGC